MLDKLTYSGRKENLDGVDCELQVGDIADPDAVARAAEGCKAIVNFAAETHVDRSILGATDFGRTEFFGTQVLLEEVRRDGRPLRPGLDRRGLRRPRARRLRQGDRPGSTRRAPTASPRPRATSTSPPTCAPSASTRRSRAGRTPTGRTSTRRSSCRSSSRTRSTASRCPCTATGARSATGCTSRTTAPAIELVLREGRPGEIYNVGGGNERENMEITQRIVELTGRRPGTRPPRRPTVPGTTAATRSTRRSCARWAGSRERTFEEGLARDGRVVPGEPGLVGADQVRRVPGLLPPPVRRAPGLVLPRFVAERQRLVELLAPALEVFGALQVLPRLLALAQLGLRAAEVVLRVGLVAEVVRVRPP